MKHADLTTGHVYAVRYSDEPHLLLSTDVYANRYTRGDETWERAAPGVRPSPGKRGRGFVMLAGSADSLAEITDPGAMLRYLEIGDAQQLPDGCRVELVTTLTRILGPYETVMSEKARQAAAEAARIAASVARYNAALDVIRGLAPWQPHDGFVTCLGGFQAPNVVSVPIEYAERIAMARDEETREVRAFLAAADRMRDDWAEGSPDRKNELWQAVHTHAERVHDRFDGRTADLDRRAAELPDGGLGTKP